MAHYYAAPKTIRSYQFIYNMKRVHEDGKLMYKVDTQLSWQFSIVKEDGSYFVSAVNFTRGILHKTNHTFDVVDCMLNNMMFSSLKNALVRIDNFMRNRAQASCDEHNTVDLVVEWQIQNGHSVDVNVPPLTLLKRNMLNPNGGLMQIAFGTPSYMDPSCEAYHTM